MADYGRRWKYVAPPDWATQYQIPELNFDQPPHKYVLTVKRPFTVPEYTDPYPEGTKTGIEHLPGEKFEIIRTQFDPGPDGGYLCGMTLRDTWVNLGTIFGRGGHPRSTWGGFLAYCEWELAALPEEVVMEEVAPPLEDVPEEAPPPLKEVPKEVVMEEVPEEVGICLACNEAPKAGKDVKCNGTDEQHTLCQPCLVSYMAGLVGTPDDLGRHAARGSHVLCSMPNCNGEYGDQQLANHMPEELWDQHLKAKVDIQLKDRRVELDREYEARVNAGVKRRRVMDSFEAEVAAAVRNVADDILTMKCPNCDAAWIDFDGCFALKCRHCGRAFCGWCLHDCGHDAHQHVKGCSESMGMKDEYFGTQEQFEKVMNKRKKRLLEAYLEKMAGSAGSQERKVCKAVIERLRRLEGVADLLP